MKTLFPMSLPKLRPLSLPAVMAAALVFLPVSGYSQGPASNDNQPWGLFVGKIPLAGGLHFHELVSFHFDGTMTSANSLMFGNMPPLGADRVSGYFGVWEKKRPGPRTIAGTGYTYTFDGPTGILTGYRRVRFTLEFSADFNSYAGTASLDRVSCPSPLSCPDPSDPSLLWTPLYSSFTILGSRLKPIPAP